MLDCLWSSGHAVRVSTETPIRTPQGERTRAMRLRLLEATVECLVELGWAGTTTTVVSQRAGVSRGAQLHHFPTKQALVVAAVEHLTELRRDELRRRAEGLPDRDRTRAVLDILAAQFVSPVFFAALELWVAARTDAGLRELVGPLERRVGRETHAYAVELLGIDEALGDNRQLVQATLDLVRGLGLAASLTDDTRRRATVLDSWATVLDHELVTA
jgi:AcrR family transcriptional regulator